MGACFVRHFVAVLLLILPATAAANVTNIVLAPNPNPKVPLAGVLSLDAEIPVVLRLTGTGQKTGEAPASFDVTFATQPQGSVSLPVLGLRPDRHYTLSLQVAPARSPNSFETVAENLVLETPPLPSQLGDFPPIRVTKVDAERMEPGVLMFTPRRRIIGMGHEHTDAQRDWYTGWGMIVALDSQGEIIWYYNNDARIAGIERLKNGNLFFHVTDFRSFEIDMLGNVQNVWYAEGRPGGPVEGGIAVAVPTLHHQPHETPQGTFLAMAAVPQTIEDFYTPETDPDAPRKTQPVMGDRIIEFDRAGNII